LQLSIRNNNRYRFCDQSFTLIRRSLPCRRLNMTFPAGGIGEVAFAEPCWTKSKCRRHRVAFSQAAEIRRSSK